MVSFRSSLYFLSFFRSSSAPCSRRVALTLSTSFAASSAAPSRTVCSAAAAPTTTSSTGPSVLGQSSRTRTTSLSAAAADSSSQVEAMTGYLDAASAAALDQELMSEPGFSLEQLMELAGLSVAEAVYAVVVADKNNSSKRDISKNNKHRILIVCGPGNNGGDGLVAARHLVMFGMECVVVYPKQSTRRHFVNLVQQCQDVGIPVETEMPDNLEGFTAIVDSIFGFSFHGELREPFAQIMEDMKTAQTENGIVTIAVDVPSGWNVDEGDVAGTGFVPDVLVSLTAPKHCSKEFPGRHFVGGRFLPPALAEKFNINMPPYPGVSQVVEIQSSARPTIGWEEEYAAHVAEKEAKEFAANDAPQKPSDETWEVQYDAYLQEKEAAEKE